MSVREIVEATGGRLLSGPPDVTFPRLFTDSREVQSGGLFVALRGGQHDGHVFIPQAVERGAAGVLCERPPQGVNGAAVILVDDTRRAPPPIGVVLNVGLAHVGLLGSIEAVASAKRELVEGLAPNGLAVLNADDRRVRAMSAVARRFTLYGFAADAAVRADRVRLHGLDGSSFTLSTPRGKAEVYLRLPGHHSISNALAAAAVALEFEFDAAAVASALHGFIPPSRRMNILTGRNGATVIDDSYNASPGSMQAALEVLRLAPRGSLRVAVLGDMLELGDHAEQAHEEIGSLAGKTADILIAVGEYAPRMVQSARRAGLAADRALVVEGADEAVAALTPWLNAQTQVLVKGSRGMRLERVVEQIREPA